jgi:hypothetical protein
LKLERVIVETWGPFRAFALFTLLDGRVVIVPNTPTVVNSTDAQLLKMLNSTNVQQILMTLVQRRERERKQGRERQTTHRQRGKTKRRFNGSPDKEVYRSPKLRRSEIAKAVAEFDLQPDADIWLSHAELKRAEGEALAAAVRFALQERRARWLKNKP